MNGTVPPPPPELGGTPASMAEVNIRTMASDLASLGEAASRGYQVAPQGERTVVPVRGTGEARPRTAVVVLTVLAALGFFAILFYYFLPFLRSVRQPAPGNPGNSSTPIEPSPETPTPFVHETSFREAPDETLTLVLGGAVELQSYDEKIAVLEKEMRSDSVLAEVRVVRADERALGWAEYLRAAEIPLFEAAFWNASFNPDFTMFLYRDAQGVWPGFIVEAKPEASALLLAPEIGRLESDGAGILSVFPRYPGESQGAFRDVQFLGEPVRTKSFTLPGASFSYGWFRGDVLVISTSLDGLRWAVRHL